MHSSAKRHRCRRSVIDCSLTRALVSDTPPMIAIALPVRSEVERHG
jgi:hypothetical protein